MVVMSLVLLASGGLAFAGDTFLLEPRAAVRFESPLVVNFEGSRCAGVEARGSPDGGWTLCAHPESPAWLADAGVIAATLDNNHAADGDPKATATLLEAAGITTRLPWCRDGLCVVSWYDRRDDLERALKTVTRTARRGDVVVLVHQTRGSFEERRRLLQRFADAGARLVLASGTHRVEPIERYRGAYLFHGLGDFAFDCACSDGTRGLVVEVRGRGALPTARLVKTSRRGAGTRLGERIVDEAELVALAEASRQLDAPVAVVDGSLVLLP